MKKHSFLVMLGLLVLFPGCTYIVKVGECIAHATKVALSHKDMKEKDIDDLKKAAKKIVSKESAKANSGKKQAFNFAQNQDLAEFRELIHSKANDLRSRQQSGGEVAVAAIPIMVRFVKAFLECLFAKDEKEAELSKGKKKPIAPKVKNKITDTVTQAAGG